MTNETDNNLDKLVAGSLAFQRKWQRLAMAAYVVSTIGVLFCTTGGTYAAARDNTQFAAALAAASTILIGLEKSLLFREKWKFHLAIATRLSILQIKLQLPDVNITTLTGEYAAILDSYANSIPIAGREGQ